MHVWDHLIILSHRPVWKATWDGPLPLTSLLTFWCLPRLRSSEGENQRGHVRCTYCRNFSAAYPSPPSVLNSESLKSHAEGMSHGLRVWWARINDFRSLERCAGYGCWACDSHRRYWHLRHWRAEIFGETIQGIGFSCSDRLSCGRMRKIVFDSIWIHHGTNISEPTR